MRVCILVTQDYIDVIPATVEPPSPPPLTLADTQATPTTRKMFSLLVGMFGKRVLAGTQVRVNTLDAVEYAFKASGKRPALVEGGLLKYSPSWAERGGDANASGYVESLGEWSTDGSGNRGLLALCWHWNAPCRLLDTKAHPDHAHPWYQVRRSACE